MESLAASPWTQEPGKSAWSVKKHQVLPVIFGIFMVILLPYIHLGFFYRWSSGLVLIQPPTRTKSYGDRVFSQVAPRLWTDCQSIFWEAEKEAVDRDACTCSCWDTRFKGAYQKGVAHYKHVYFNLTSNTLRIWIYVALFVIALYESVRYLARLYLGGRLRYATLVLAVSVLYPHYYAWWAYFNYANDDFYKQWNHQTFFTLTELASTLVVLRMCDAGHDTPPRSLLLVVSVAVLHLVAGGGDQFVQNLLLRQGEYFQVFRDFGLMIPDLLHVGIPLWLWRRWCTRNGVAMRDSVTRRDLLLACGGVAGLLLLCYNL